MTEPSSSLPHAGIAWLPPSADGRFPGAGDDQLDAPVTVDEELEPGLAALRFVYDSMHIDAEWSVPDQRSFTWWGHRLATRVTAEPGLDDRGIVVHRLVARTAMLKDVADPELAGQILEAGNRMAAMSAMMLDKDARTIGAVATMWVHAETRTWASRLFALAVALQAAQAHDQVEGLAPAFGAQLDYTAHPSSGARPTPDEMLDWLAVIAEQGQEPSHWVGPEMEDALDFLGELPPVARAVGDDASIVLELDDGAKTGLVEISARAPHPSLGNGLMVRSSIEPRPGTDHRWAAEMNRRELEVVNPAMFLGSWVAESDRPTFVTFLPNFAASIGVGVVNIGLSAVNRAMWAAHTAP